MYRYLVSLLAKRLRETDDTISALAFLSAKGRVAYALLEIADSLGEEMKSGEIVIREMFNQKELAAMAGVARENTNRILKEWERSKLVTRSSRSYLIKDKKASSKMKWSGGSDSRGELAHRRRGVEIDAQTPIISADRHVRRSRNRSSVHPALSTQSDHPRKSPAARPRASRS